MRNSSAALTVAIQVLQTSSSCPARRPAPRGRGAHTQGTQQGFSVGLQEVGMGQRGGHEGGPAGAVGLPPAAYSLHGPLPRRPGRRPEPGPGAPWLLLLLAAPWSGGGDADAGMRVARGLASPRRRQCVRAPRRYGTAKDWGMAGWSPTCITGGGTHLPPCAAGLHRGGQRQPGAHTFFPLAGRSLRSRWTEGDGPPLGWAQLELYSHAVQHMYQCQR